MIDSEIFTNIHRFLVVIIRPGECREHWDRNIHEAMLVKFFVSAESIEKHMVTKKGFGDKLKCSNEAK